MIKNKVVFLILFLIHLILIIAVPIIIVINGIHPDTEIFLGIIALIIYAYLVYRTIGHYKIWKNTDHHSLSPLASDNEKLQEYKTQTRTYAIGAVIFTILIVILLHYQNSITGVYTDLLVFLQNKLGYYVTVSIPLLIFFLNLLIAKSKIKKLESQC